MALRSVPTPGSSDVWGKMLNDHLAQTKNATNGAFNSFDKIDDINWDPTCRPKISTLILDDIGKTYLNKKTGNWHEVYSPNGSTPMAWKVLNQSVLNILDYGGREDGVFNNLAAINACLAITTCSKIYFPTGVYAIENTIQIPDGKTLIGDGGLLSEIKNTNTGHASFLAVTNTKNITFDSLYINGNIARVGGYGSTLDFTLEIANTNPYTFEPRKNNVVIKNCVFAGSGFCTIGANNAHGILIDGCKFIKGKDFGVKAIAGSSEIKIVNCSFEASHLTALQLSNSEFSSTNNYDIVTQVRNIIIANNYIEVGDGKGLTAECTGIKLDGCKNTTVSNNIINITVDGLYGFFLLPSGISGKGVDYNNINIIGNMITNHSTYDNAVGINITIKDKNGSNVLNDPSSKNVKIANNILIHETTTSVGASFVAISIYCVNKVMVSGNTIKKLVGARTPASGISVDAPIADCTLNVTIHNNDVSGAIKGIYCKNAGSGSNHTAIITNNICYENTTYNVEIGTGWNTYLGNNYLKEGETNNIASSNLRENSW